MKYKILVLMLLVVGMCWGQETKHYCEMRCFWMFKGDYTVQLDLGDVKSPFDNKSDCDIIDETGKAIRFTSEMDALNWMSERGWSLVEYKYHSDSPNATYYILSKTCTNDNLKDGIKLKYQFKKKK